jgi:hypothetical protein
MPLTLYTYAESATFESANVQWSFAMDVDNMGTSSILQEQFSSLVIALHHSEVQCAPLVLEFHVDVNREWIGRTKDFLNSRNIVYLSGFA